MDHQHKGHAHRLFARVAFPRVAFQKQVVGLPVKIDVSLDLCTAAVLCGLCRAVKPDELTGRIAHRFLCQQSRAIRTTDGKDRADLYAVAVCGLECRHNAGVVIDTALQNDVLPHRFRTNNFMQIVLYDGVTKACGNIRP